jgi:hypothetical protein
MILNKPPENGSIILMCMEMMNRVGDKELILFIIIEMLLGICKKFNKK